MSQAQLYFLKCSLFLINKTRERLATPELMSHEDLVSAVRTADHRLETISEFLQEAWLEKKEV